MKTFPNIALLALGVLFINPSIVIEAETLVWPSWRGPTLTGVVPNGKPPIEWSESKNIKWKAPIPGSGLATPIVWGDQIFLLTAVEMESPRQDSSAEESDVQRRADRPERRDFNREEVLQQFDKDKNGELSEEERAEMRASFGAGGRRRGDRDPDQRPERSRGGPGRGGPRGPGGPEAKQPVHAFDILSVDRETGKIQWQRTANTLAPHEGHHATHGFASASPITDGQHLWASFGSRGLFCYSLNGNLVWEKDLGDMRTRNGFGEATSPVLAGDRLIVNWDNEDQSYITALDKATGETLWKTDRDEPTTWTTPVVVEVEGTLQVIVAGANKTRSYNAETGEVIWEASGLTANVIPTPVVGLGNVYVASGYRGRSVQAIKLSSKGDVSNTDNIVWSAPHSAPYVPSPVLSGDRLFMNKSNDPYLTCFNALSGEIYFQDEPLEGIRGIYASPLAANGYLYIAGKEGTTLVLKDSSAFEIVATNTLDDPIDASPVIIGDTLFIRGHHHLYCIANES